jgi:hypothetical protein
MRTNGRKTNGRRTNKHNKNNKTKKGGSTKKCENAKKGETIGGSRKKKSAVRSRSPTREEIKNAQNQFKTNQYERQSTLQRHALNKKILANAGKSTASSSQNTQPYN